MNFIAKKVDLKVQQYTFVLGVFSILLVKKYYICQELEKVQLQKIQKNMDPKNYKDFSIDCEYSSLLTSILECIAIISKELEETPVFSVGSVNKFGDQQLHQDIVTDELVEKHLRQNELAYGFASEERPELHDFGRSGEGRYIVTYDPLDGSSIVDTNFSVGSIFTIWPYTDKKLVGEKVGNQVNSLLAVYGPRTTVILYNPELNKVQQYTLIKGTRWILSHEDLLIRNTTKLFSPGNLRSASQHEQYNKIVNDWIKGGYTLRYTGGLVPDATQLLIKGNGIFSCFASKSHKAKLRVLYQVAAVGFLIHKAGGTSVIPGKESILDYEISTYDDRIQFAAGSKTEVDKLTQLF